MLGLNSRGRYRTSAAQPAQATTTMSADLFAEFGLNSTSAQSISVSQQQGSQGSSLIPDLNAADDAEFDDFVSPEQDDDSQQSGQSNGARRSYEDDNVLFDATLEPAPNAEADDWGDFETAEPLPAPPAPPALTSRTDLLSSDLDLLESMSIEEPPRQPAPKVAPKAVPRPAPKAAPKKSQAQKRGPITTAKQPEPEDDSFGDWGDFIDGPPTQAPRPAAQPAPAARKPNQHGKTPSQTFTVSQERVPASQVRPTNIPPPSVLLEFFPRALDQLRDQATQTRKNPQQTDILNSTASATITALKTAARVIAGRTLRWKRDTILSQSMRIGPARSGKPGGMKLSTVNKNEDIKEQQQAVDVIALWRDRAALFSSVVQASGKKPVPIIADNIRAITASPDQGALKAPHACALCGLKRDERLPRVDEGVEDSFGEWWTDHWGHTDCRDFWERNSKLLDQR